MTFFKSELMIRSNKNICIYSTTGLLYSSYNRGTADRWEQGHYTAQQGYYTAVITGALQTGVNRVIIQHNRVIIQHDNRGTADRCEQGHYTA